MKITFTLPEDQLRFLQNQARKEHATVTAVLQRAINTERFLSDQRRLGNKLIMEDARGCLREVVRH
jgi:hypothetical protein